MKKYIRALLAVCTMMLLLFAGCGKDASGKAEGTPPAKHDLSKAEWIGMLGDRFGYNQSLSDTNLFSDVDAGSPYYEQIQSCCEWDVLTEEGRFEPDSRVTWKYAVETAVRAIGTDRLERAGESVSESALAEFFGNHIANIDQIDLNDGLSAADAEQILEYAADYKRGLRYEQIFEYEYCEHVYELEETALTLKGDGRTALINDGASYAAGDVLVLPTTDISVARAIKVTDADAQELHYTEAGLDDVYTDLLISGSYEGRIISVEPADAAGTELSYHSPSSYQALPCRAQGKNPYTASFLTPETYSVADTEVHADKNGVHFNCKFGKGGEFKVDITDIDFDVTFEKKRLLGVKEASASVRFHDQIQASYKAEHFAQTIPLGKITLAGGGPFNPISLKLNLSLNIGMDGEASLTYTSSVYADVGYRDGKGLYHTFDNTDQNCDFHAMITVTAEPTVKVSFHIFGEVANIKFTTGIVAIATQDIDFTGKQPACTDIYMYVPLRWAINQDNCLITYFKPEARYEAVVWDSKNSGVTAHYHWEDGTRTPDDQCTRNTQDVETPVVDEQGKPYDEYLIFEFEEIDFAVIRVETPSVYLEQGETMTLAFTEIPYGYTASDLVYETDNSSVCTVSGGRITGVSGGSAVVRIGTSDNRYSTYITVTVKGEFKDVSGFQSL